LLGKIKFFGVSLGVTFVLFVGILAGHIGFNIGNMMLLNFLRDFGLILFVFSIGMQVGPGFFSSFKKDGMQMNLIAALTILLNVVVAVAIYYMDSELTVPQMVGILSGAVTNTPGLGAAQQALETLGQSGADDLSMGYAAAYPLGVIGIILSMILLKVFCKIKVEDEAKVIEEEKENNQLKPYVVTFKVENSLLNGKTVRELNSIVEHHFVISRLRKTDGEVIIPTSKTVLNSGDLLLIVCSAQDEDIFHSVIGSTVEYEWGALAQGEVVSRRILVTNSHYNGRTLGSLRLHNGYRLNATRVNRAGIDLIASSNLTLQVGDRITVVGNPSHIERLADRLGNSMKRLHEPNMFTMFIGIFLGIIVGLIPISIPGMSAAMQLGLAGGPLIVAILISRFGYKMKLVTYTSTSASLMLREIGICLFLASVGISAGDGFAETVFTAQGLRWVTWGFIITFVPLMIMAFVARWKFKFNYLSILGIMSGSYTDPPALAYSNKVANNDAPAVAYSTVYPLSMFLRVITAQLLILLLMN
ncbi:MAG TPA: putative transporter, partial [Candidatus Limisoma gallistercoris]|nr:putative transporter [Candidatus Limisoma gallistercoris]